MRRQSWRSSLSIARSPPTRPRTCASPHLFSRRDQLRRYKRAIKTETTGGCPINRAGRVPDGVLRRGAKHPRVSRPAPFARSKDRMSNCLQPPNPCAFGWLFTAPGGAALVIECLACSLFCHLPIPDAEPELPPFDG